MKVLSIAYNGKEISRFRVASPLILIGRSPLCDVLLRTPGVGSVHFIFEWIGNGEFKPETAHKDEWVMTEVGEAGLGANEKRANKSVVGQGAIFHESPLQSGNFVFSWIEDRLVEADLNKKIISQQVAELKETSGNAQNKNVASVLEVICINRDVDSVTAVHHFSFLKPRDWSIPLLSQFATTPQVAPGVRAAQFSLPSDAKSQLIRHTGGQEKFDPGKVSISLHDVLHVEWHQTEYYFRVVPKVFVPTVRRSIWSDPFYVISTFCILIGAFGFYLIFRNVKDERQTIVAPPRIAQIQLMEMVKPPPPPPPPDPAKISEPAPEPPPPAPRPQPKGMGLLQKKVKKPTEKAITEVIPSTKNDAQAKNSKDMKNAPKVVDKNKGGLDIPAEKAPVNRTGFLAALKKNKNVGMVKADQVLDKGIVNDTLSGKSGDFVLEQSASGVVNNQIRKNGDTLSAASTHVNLKDRVGSGSLNVAKGDILKEGFKANYGVSGEGGLIESNFGDQVATQVEGGLDKASIQQAIRGYKQEIRTCFEKALRVKSSISGRVSYRFQISAKGAVEWIKVEKSSVDSNTLVTCVQGVVNNIKFPEAKNGQKTIVIYPFQFDRKGS